MNSTELEKFNFYRSEIYSKYFRFIVLKKKNVDNFSSLMSHIRNSIAHGMYNIIRNGNRYRFYFEDKG